jgi:hypothetical protein
MCERERGEKEIAEKIVHLQKVIKVINFQDVTITERIKR